MPGQGQADWCRKSQILLLAANNKKWSLAVNFSAVNDLVENCKCLYLTQTGTCLVIKLVEANLANNTNIINVSVQSKLASLHQEFPDIGAVNPYGYSKFAPTHGVEHFIETKMPGQCTAAPGQCAAAPGPFFAPRKRQSNESSRQC